MSNPNFRGSFIFRSHGYGILSSTYFNNGDENPFPETAKRKPNDESDPFIGEFNTVWLEASGYEYSDLIIKRNKIGTYDLSWEFKGKVIYQGTGILERNN